MPNRKPRGSPGYTFPLMLVIITALTYGASRIEIAASYRVKRDKEEELLFRGLAYMEALKEFYAKNKRYPRDLRELYGKSPDGSCFIRQIYKDPMTGKDFRLLQTEGDEIIGVVSTSATKPFRTADFEEELAGFGKATTYADWKFDARAQSEETPREASQFINVSPD
jgi:hypothetical protein